MANKTIDCSTNTFNFLSIVLNLAGIQLTPFLKSISYSDSIEKNAVFGGQSLPVGVTKGKYTAKLSLEFLSRESYQDLIAKLGPYWLEKTFNVTCSYGEPGKKTISDVIQQCQFTGQDLSASGNEAIPVKVELLVLGKIKWGGLEPIN